MKSSIDKSLAVSEQVEKAMADIHIYWAQGPEFGGEKEAFWRGVILQAVVNPSQTKL